MIGMNLSPVNMGTFAIVSKFADMQILLIACKMYFGVPYL